MLLAPAVFQVALFSSNESVCQSGIFEGVIYCHPPLPPGFVERVKCIMHVKHQAHTRYGYWIFVKINSFFFAMLHKLYLIFPF